MLYPRLARYRDFYWGTLGTYGGGMLLAEVVIILLQTLLSYGGPPLRRAPAMVCRCQPARKEPAEV